MVSRPGEYCQLSPSVDLQFPVGPFQTVDFIAVHARRMTVGSVCEGVFGPGNSDPGDGSRGRGWRAPFETAAEKTRPPQGERWMSSNLSLLPDAITG